jgi:vacuolar-type H+-ATPase subunit B/Vma2
MRIGWEILRTLPAAELTRLSRKQVERYITAAHG